MQPILETIDLVKYYGDGDSQIKAIDHTSITVSHGEFVAVVGRSGSGKSTLLHMLGGLDRPDSGQVIISGQDLFSLQDEQLAVFRRRKIGFIFQDFNLIPALNVWENIVLPIGLDGKHSEHRHGRPFKSAAQHAFRGTKAADGHCQGAGFTPRHHPG